MQGPVDIIERKPEYGGGSIVNLTASLVEAAGANPAYPPLALLERAALADARHLILLVIDGLGRELLSSVAEAEALRGDVAGTITSVYPPTTATAVTAFLTGLAPQQHGLTGWFMHFASLGAVVTVLPFTTRLGNASLHSAGVDPAELLGHTPIFDLLPCRSFSVAPHDIANSAFNRSHTGRAEVRPYKTLEDFFAALTAIVRTRDERTCTYAYWPHVDRLAHEHGPASETVHAHIVAFDRAYERFLEATAGTGTALLATADHGFVDVDPAKLIDMADHRELKDSLLLPLCGEPRTAYCYVAADRADAFERYVERELGHAMLCVPSAALLEQGYFGTGEAHPELRARIGTHTLLARPGYTVIDRVPGEKPFRLRGVHGGGSLAELEVPLIASLPR